MRLHILNVVVDLDVESRFVYLNCVVVVAKLLRHLRVCAKWLTVSLGLPPDLLRLLSDVVLNQVVDKLVKMRLTIICLWQITVLVSHRVEHRFQLLDKLLGSLILTEVLFAVLDELSLHLFHQFSFAECFCLVRSCALIVRSLPWQGCFGIDLS
jgi:hypothetical protein